MFQLKKAPLQLNRTIECIRILTERVLPFSKLNKIFFEYFDPENILLHTENKKISG